MVYHGTQVKGIRLLMPHLSLHGEPYVYFTADPAVAAIYTIHAVSKPYAWYPYGYGEDGIPVYYEYYRDALRDVYEGKAGYLYTCEALPKSCAPILEGREWRAAKPVPVDGCIPLLDVYAALLEYEAAGKLRIVRYETLTEGQKQQRDRMIAKEIEDCRLKENGDCDYSIFLKERFPHLWECG